MKTTLDLPDDLLIKAKQVAAQRRTTLKDMVTRSLRREIGLDQSAGLQADSAFEIGPLGLPVLKRTGSPISAEDYQKLIGAAEAEDDRRYLPHARSPILAG